MSKPEYLSETPILDFGNATIKALIAQRKWLDLQPFDRIGAAYTFVKDEIHFGYNQSDDLRASQVLADGYGQCNTKSTLLMALLRAMNIPCRFHGFTIDNGLQKGAIPVSIFRLAPKTIIHSWVEVCLPDQAHSSGQGDDSESGSGNNSEWLNLEGFILDQTYLKSIQNRFSSQKGAFSGYAIATPCLENPQVDWRGKSTYIQREGIHDDFGVFDSPDEFYQQYGTNLTGLKRLLFQYVLRYYMNWNVARIRRARFSARKAQACRQNTG